MLTRSKLKYLVYMENGSSFVCRDETSFKFNIKFLLVNELKCVLR